MADSGEDYGDVIGRWVFTGRFGNWIGVPLGLQLMAMSLASEWEWSGAILLMTLSTVLAAGVVLGLRRRGPFETVAAAVWPPFLASWFELHEAFDAWSPRRPMIRVLGGGAAASYWLPAFMALVLLAAGGGWLLGRKAR